MKYGFQALLCLMVLIGFSGWDYSRHSIPVSEIKNGGPQKDGIPAIDRPHFVDAKLADKRFLQPNDRVLGLVIRGKKKAYPIKILNWHEVVNDRVGGQPVVVTFCPLCGTGMVFDAQAGQRVLNFGVSGLLYQSDMLLYDRQTESLWSQIKQEAVTGPLTGTKLKLLASTHTTWQAWQAQHPDTQVLSTLTGHVRDYDRDPYGDYKESEQLMFGVKNRSPSYHPKETVLGVVLKGVAKAYPFPELGRAPQPLNDRVGEVPVQIVFDATSRTAVAQDGQGGELPSVTGFWFAWYAFHPETQVYQVHKQ